MGLFWDYFKKTLHFPLVWKPGPLAQLAIGGAAALDQAHENIEWLRKQFSPDTCDSDFIENFARSRGIKRHETESEESFVNRVIYAYAWQLLGGKAAGLPIVFDLYGFPDTVITNMRDADPERWAEFQVELGAVADLSEPTWDAVTWLANEFKPARSKLAGIIFTRTQTSKAPLILTATITGEIITIDPWTVSELETLSPAYAAACADQIEIITIGPKEIV